MPTYIFTHPHDSTGEHPHVAKIHNVYEDRHFLYIVMELLNGGELFDRIQKLSKYTENDARRVFKQMCHAVEHLHSHRIAHCDIQPSNFLFAAPAEDAPIKMIDFGMSARLKDRPEKYMSKARGTLMYAAPEVLKGKYFESCDMWSLGVSRQPIIVILDSRVSVCMYIFPRHPPETAHAFLYHCYLFCPVLSAPLFSLLFSSPPPPPPTLSERR